MQLAFGCVDLGGEVADAHVECSDDASDRAPVRASLAALKTADECGIDFQSFGEMLLRDPRLLAECAKGAAKDQLVLFGCRFGLALHSENPHVARAIVPGYLWSGLRASLDEQSQVPPHRCNGRGRGTESTSSRRAGHATNAGVAFEPDRLSGPPTTRRNRDE
jgi:hypothetical protein